MPKRTFKLVSLFMKRKENGLGDYFTSSLAADIESLKVYAGVHAVYYKTLFRMRSRTFPFGIFYTFTNNTATIAAVIDLRRHPEKIRDHLDKI